MWGVVEIHTSGFWFERVANGQKIIDFVWRSWVGPKELFYRACNYGEISAKILTTQIEKLCKNIYIYIGSAKTKLYQARIAVKRQKPFSALCIWSQIAMRQNARDWMPFPNLIAWRGKIAFQLEIAGDRISFPLRILSTLDTRRRNSLIFTPHFKRPNVLSTMKEMDYYIHLG